MEGTYPIVNGAVRIGQLRVHKSGLMMVFEAQAENTGGILRLSIYGEDCEGYLGVMSPDGSGELFLRRSLSRAALKNMPGHIDYAGPAGELRAKPREKPKPEPEPAPRLAVEPEPEQEPQPKFEPEPEQALQDDDTLWYSSPDGTLSTFDGRRMLVAIPADDPKLPPGAEDLIRMINGRKYVVFPW